MAVQAGLCLAWSETPEDKLCHVVAHMYMPVEQDVLLFLRTMLFCESHCNFEYCCRFLTNMCLESKKCVEVEKRAFLSHLL